MAIYPKSDTDRRVPHPKLKMVVAEIFARSSISEGDADLLAKLWFTPIYERNFHCEVPTS
jgi:hypothetical protein